MKFVSVEGWEGGFIKFKIEGGCNSESVGDQVWISGCGTELEVYECVHPETLIAFSKLFDKPKAFLGAFRSVVGNYD